MKKKLYKYVLAIGLVLLASSVSALEIEVNGKVVKTIFNSELQEVARQRTLAGELKTSVVLEELLPVCSSLKEISITSESGHTTSIRTYDEVLPLYHSYILPGERGSVNFFMKNQFGEADLQIEGVQKISVSAEQVESEKLEVWISWEGVEALKAEIRRWGELHDIDVKVNEVPKSDSKLLSVLRGGGRPPDVILIQSDYIPALTAAGALQPIVRFPTDQFAEKSLDALSLDGSLWAVPFYFDAQVLFYRSDLLSLSEFARADGVIEWDLDDFEKSARRIKEKGIAPASWNAYSAYWLLPFQLGFGKRSITGAEGSVRVDDPATIEAVEYLKRLKDEGILDLRERDSMFSRFISGDIAMMLSASFSIPELERLGVPFGVAPFPEGPVGPIAPLLDFKGFAVSRKTRHPILSRRFLLSMSDPAVQHQFTREVFKLPVSEAAWQLTAQQNRYFSVLRNSYDNGVSVPSTEGYKIYKNTMWKMLRFLLTGKLPVEEGLQRAQLLIDKQITR
ncbi:MAG: extracellular solute-binding protein [Spirochaetia bacterium]